MKTIEDEQNLIKTAAITVFLATVFLLFVYVYRPMEREIIFYNKEAAKYINSKSQVEQMIRNKDFKMPAGSLVTKEGVTGVIHEIMRIGEDLDINFITISLDEKTDVKRTEFPNQALVMDLQTNYSNLGEFLDGLNTLETGAVRIRSFDIVRDETIQPFVKTNLVVEIFLKDVKRGKR